jgi:hypothetical protein
LSLSQYLSYSPHNNLALTHTTYLPGFTKFLYLYKSLAHPLETQSASQLQEFLMPSLNRNAIYIPQVLRYTLR